MELPPVAELPENPMSVWVRLINLFSVPGEVFDGVARSRFSAANWWAPALLAALIGMACQWLIFGQPVLFQQIRDLQDRSVQMQVDQGKLTPDQARQAREFMRGDLMVTIVRVGGAVSAAGVAVVGPFWWALLLWVTAKMALRAPVGFWRALEVAGLSSFVIALGGVAATFLAIGMGRLGVGPHLGLLLPEYDLLRPAHIALGVINVFGLWHLALLAVGLSRLAQRSFGATLGILAGVWIGFKGLAVVLGLGPWVL